MRNASRMNLSRHVSEEIHVIRMDECVYMLRRGGLGVDALSHYARTLENIRIYTQVAYVVGGEGGSCVVTPKRGWGMSHCPYEYIVSHV